MYDQLAKKGNRVHARRRIFEDGRVTDQVEFWVGLQEQQVWASGPDWRSAIDIAVQSDPEGSFINGTVRLYARTGNTRALVKQGRFLGPTINRTLLVLSTRSVPCDEMIVTTQSPFAPTPPLTEGNKVRLSVAMHGFEPSPEIADIAQTFVGSGSVAFTVSPEGSPAFLYGFYATLPATSAAVRYIWISSDSAFGTSIVPPVPISPGGVASLAVSDHPVSSVIATSGSANPGLFVALSDTYSTFTQSADPWAINLNYT